MAIVDKESQREPETTFRSAWQSYLTNRPKVLDRVSGPRSWLGAEQSVSGPVRSHELLELPGTVVLADLPLDYRNAAIDLGYADPTLLNVEERTSWQTVPTTRRALAQAAFLGLVVAPK